MRILPNSLLACITFASCVLLSLSSEDGEDGVDEILQQIDVMVEWLIDEDGSMDPRIEIRRSNPKDHNSRIGIFVKEAIQADELLIEIPGEIKIQLDDIPKKEESDDGSNDDDDDSSDDDNDEDEDEDNKVSKDYQNHICKLAWALRDEYDEEEESDYYPYIKYLQFLQPTLRQLPAMFSTAGQHLLLQTQRDTDIRTLTGFEEPNDMVMWPWRVYEEDCIQDEEDEGNSLSPYFLAMAVQHGFEHAFIPFYDLVMHHSMKAKINVFTKPSIFGEQDFGIYALRDLEPGEELFRSYRDCNDCHTDRGYSLGTPEMLRDYGFVEPYPHTFHFVGDITVFVDDMGDGKYVARCVNDKFPLKRVVEARIGDLTEVIEYMVQTSEAIVEKYEYETIKEYHKALVVALTTVLPHCVNDDPAGVSAAPKLGESSEADKRDEL
mmetsp:Transcript_20424/g.50082  ORF Transcript_20424/g.50082 Transcript_20424/m.50082 type:complete len:436 (+) Transcript_20424:80-1387(+)